MQFLNNLQKAVHELVIVTKDMEHSGNLVIRARVEAQCVELLTTILTLSTSTRQDRTEQLVLLADKLNHKLDLLQDK
jgi:hypothetical protein